MIWLLDLIEDHRAAVRYDLLRHGYRLEWVGTHRLPWGDAVTIVTKQPTQQSAVFRDLYPDKYDMTRESQILEIVAVILQSANIARGTQSKAKAADFPKTFEDLFKKEPTTPKASEAEILDAFQRMDQLLAE